MTRPPKCEHCIFFNRAGDVAGECRRHSPKLDWRVAQWPVVRVVDFCGDFIEAGDVK